MNVSTLINTYDPRGYENDPEQKKVLEDRLNYELGVILKMGFDVNADIAKLTQVSHAVSEIANLTHNSFMPYVGSKSFTHKGGMHIVALLKDPRTYEHVSP